MNILVCVLQSACLVHVLGIDSLVTDSVQLWTLSLLLFHLFSKEACVHAVALGAFAVSNHSCSQKKAFENNKILSNHASVQLK